MEHEQAIGELGCVVTSCGLVWTVEDEEKVIAGCRGSEHVAQKHTCVALYTGRIHTQAVVSQGVYTRGLYEDMTHTVIKSRRFVFELMTAY